VQGGSPTDPRTFIGTGILRGNRGVVCVDELPAIPTKVQVLFHPMLQEGKIILEEYNWVRPIDIFFIATGNPTGFSHVNRVPEPLLDRLELITMGFPEEDVERGIMLKEGFKIHDDFYANGRRVKVNEPVYAQPSDLKRRVFAPWWIIDIVVKVVRYSRDCPNIDRGASIRGSIRSLDHTLSSAELNNRLVVGLADVSEGLKLALRGRLRLRADLLGLDDNPITFMRKNEEVVEDILWYAARDVGSSVLKALEDDFDLNKLTNEIKEIISQGKVFSEFGSDSDMVKVIRFIEQQQPWKNPSLLSDVGDLIRDAPKYVEEPILNAYRMSAIELLAHSINASKETELIPIMGDYFTPKKMK
jgi:MoxR-like ATPase